jgi:cyclopropane fatty-acyl-phospholipid synthase-like methyltransferase
MHEHDFEWNDIYTGTTDDYMEADSELLEIIETLHPGAALDIGCGSGGLVAAMVEKGWEVTGVDIAPKAVEAARKVLDARGLHASLEVANAADWKPSQRFDLITNSFALPATQAEQSALFQTIRDSLNPGGTVLIKDFDAEMQKREEFSRFHCPTIEELAKAFEGFEVLRAEVKQTPHAHGHRGEADAAESTAALFCARKA